MSFKRKLKALTLSAVVAVGIVLLFLGAQLMLWVDPQVAHYNMGLAALNAGDFERAREEFDLSIQAFHEAERRSWSAALVYPAPSLELAARAYFYKGWAFIAERNVREAVRAWQDATRLNPGNDWQSLGVELPQISALELVAYWVKYDLEWLYDNNKSQSQQPQPGNESGQPQEGEKDGLEQELPQPGDTPGSQPGQSGPGSL